MEPKDSNSLSAVPFRPQGLGRTPSDATLRVACMSLILEHVQKKNIKYQEE